MQAIKRTFYTTTCTGERINDHGEYEDYTTTLEGDYSAVRATKYLQRKLKDQSLYINHTECNSETRILSIEDFKKYSSPIN